MLSIFNSLIVAVVGALCVTVVARPHGEELGSQRPLSDVVNKTMCPIEIFYDKNPIRVPRLIKHLRCANTTNTLCTKTKSKYGCCAHRHHPNKDNPDDVPFVRKCVEIQDTVLVTYEGSKELKPLTVSVGCTCMLIEMNTTHEA